MLQNSLIYMKIQKNNRIFTFGKVCNNTTPYHR